MKTQKYIFFKSKSESECFRFYMALRMCHTFCEQKLHEKMQKFSFVFNKLYREIMHFFAKMNLAKKGENYKKNSRKKST